MEIQQRDRVVKEALSMFIDSGVRQVRMDDIAKQLHISKRTLYEIFGDKDELLYEAMLLHLKEMDIQLDRVGSNAPNVLVSILRTSEYVTINTSQSRRLRESLREFYPKTYERVKLKSNEERQKAFKEKLMLGIEQGLIKSDTDIEFFVSMMYHISVAIVENSSNFTFDALENGDNFSTAHSILLRGVSTVKGVEVIDDFLNKNLDNE